jgi:cbb3-type cytochrome oxidase subunit 3
MDVVDVKVPPILNTGIFKVASWGILIFYGLMFLLIIYALFIYKDPNKEENDKNKKTLFDLEKKTRELSHSQQDLELSKSKEYILLLKEIREAISEYRKSKQNEFTVSKKKNIRKYKDEDSDSEEE